MEKYNHSPLRVLPKTLTSWMTPIAALWRFSKSDAITEGFHNKMQMMSRQAYGFRNFEHFRLRVLDHCGWDDICWFVPKFDPHLLLIMARNT